MSLEEAQNLQKYYGKYPNFTILFSPNNFNENDNIILNYFPTNLENGRN